MSIALKIEDPGRLLSDHLAGQVRERAERLERFGGKVEQCRVVVDGPGQHPLPGRIRVRVFLTVPETRIVINHVSGDDLLAALGDSFDAAGQRLDDYAKASRQSVKDAKQRPARS